MMSKLVNKLKIFSPDDSRDYTIETAALVEEELPEEYMPEKRIPITNQLWSSSCHDDQTEVLTKEGWKMFDDITKEDELASANPATGEIIFEHPTNIIAEWYEGEMIHPVHLSLDFAVTPNHKMVIRPWNRNDTPKQDDKFVFVEAGKLPWLFNLRTEFHTHKERGLKKIIPEIYTENNVRKPEMSFSIEDWCAFLGYYIADGTMYKNGKEQHYRVQLATGTQRKKDLVKPLLDRMGIHYVEYSDRLHFFSKQIWTEMDKLGLTGVKAHEKFVPRFIFDLDEKYMQAFLAGFNWGDGSKKHGLKRMKITTSSSILADDIQRLMLFSGLWGNKRTTDNRGKKAFVKSRGREYYITTNYITNYIDGRETYISLTRKNNIKSEPYKGMIYCATVPTHHTLFTRRGGKILFSGNCVSHALSTTMSYCELKQGYEEANIYSKGFIFANRNGEHMDIEGMVTRDAIKILQKEGDCLHHEFRWHMSDLKTVSFAFEKKEKELEEKAAPYKIKSYIRLYSDDDIKRAIYRLGAVVMCYPMRKSNDTYIEPATDAITGSHAITVIGWDKTGWWLQNSWGKCSGDNGLYHMSYEYDWREAWTFTLELNMPRNPAPTGDCINDFFHDIREFFCGLIHWCSVGIEKLRQKLGNI